MIEPRNIELPNLERKLDNPLVGDGARFEILRVLTQKSGREFGPLHMKPKRIHAVEVSRTPPATNLTFYEMKMPD